MRALNKRRRRHSSDGTKLQHQHKFISHRHCVESRINWTLCHPAKQKTQSWQSDFIGVVHLSRPSPSGHFWVGIFLGDGVPIRLRLQEKNGLKDSFFCDLRPAPFGRYEGRLVISGIPILVHIQPERHPKTSAQRYRVHFVP